MSKIVQLKLFLYWDIQVMPAFKNKYQRNNGQDGLN